MTATPTRTLQGLLTLPGGAPYGGNGKTVSIRRYGGNFVDDGAREIVKSWSNIPIDDTGLWSATIEVNEQVDGQYTSYTTVQEMQGLTWAFYFPLGDGTPVFLGTLPLITAPGSIPVQYGITQADFDTFVASLSGTYALIAEPVAVSERTRAQAAEALLAPLQSAALLSPTIDGVSAPADRLWTPHGAYPEDRAPVTIVTQWQSGHGWTATTQDASSNLNNTSNPPLGSQYATLVTQGIGVGTPARLSASGLSLDFTGKQFWLLCRITDTTFLSNLQFYAGNSGFGSYYYFELDRYTGSQAGTYVNEGEWTWIPYSFVQNVSTTGTPPLTAITDLRFAVVDTGSGGVGKVTVDFASLGYSIDSQTWAL